ncbi:MAG TPA: hypothetical protein VHV77_14030 [Pirellulales bacterium]|jgi:lipopolysaccharide export system protein LptA|nr:hypothetical protein [Pirellulales bacterium]
MCVAILSLLVFDHAARADIELPRPDPSIGVQVNAQRADRWTQGAYEVWVLHGNCTITQGSMNARSDDAVLWIRRGGDYADRQTLVIAYLEGKVHIDYQRSGMPYTLDDNSWFGEFFTTSTVDVKVPRPGPEPTPKPSLFERANARREPFAARGIRHTQFQPFDAQAATPVDPIPVGTRRLRAYPRGGNSVQAQWFPNPATQDWIAVVPTGVNLIVDGVGGAGTLDISADRLVLWTKSNDQPDLTGQALQGEGTPLEIYLEGNVVFRQGDRVIYAERVYFDVNNQTGTLLQTDLLAPVPSYLGMMRLRADLVQQTGKDSFYARNSTVTSSRFENPGYRLQMRDVIFEDNQQPIVNPYTGSPEIDPTTGEQSIAHQQTITSKNNFLFVGPVPVFYWPKFVTNLEQPTYYVRILQYSEDRIMGNKVISRFDLFQMMGMKQKPAGMDWIAGPDYLSARGFGGGTIYRYGRGDLFGFGGTTNGVIDAWGLYHDHGLDTLGSDRMGLLPESLNRGRVKARGRQYYDDGWRVTAEVSAISDRNFLEQFYEREWDTDKDFTTGVELKRLYDNQSLSIQADTRTNPQFTQTEHYPRGEHFTFGTPLLDDHLTWNEHTSLGYEKLRVESYPALNSVDTIKLQPLPWEKTSSGARLLSRQEVDAPFDLGPFKFVPYLLGEAGYWGQDLTGNDLTRLYGMAGLRSSIPFWRTDPTVESALFNVHGLAHKITLESDFSFADANAPASQLPLYDPIDDDSGELFRRRMRFNTYNLPAVLYPTAVGPPAQFDPVNYAIRSGMGTLVASPSMETAGRIALMRFNMNQRWQTKRGPPDKRRIIDWMFLDTGFTLFPDPNRDDFGQTIGLVNYNYRWHIGDRTTMISTGLFDFFNQGQKNVTVGFTIARPPRGQVYLGFYSLNGPITADVFSAYYNYRMSPKWISSTGITYDVAGAGLVGNTLALTRIGESFLSSFTFVADPYKNNVGVTFMLEPRLLPKSRTGMIGGSPIGVSGLQGLE